MSQTLGLLVLCVVLAATSVVAQNSQVIAQTQPKEDTATAHIGLVNDWELKVKEQQRKDEADNAVVTQSCAEFVAPFEAKLHAAEASLNSIEGKLEKAEEIKRESVVPENLIASVARSEKTTAALHNILAMLDKVKDVGAKHAELFKSIVRDGRDSLGDLVKAKKKYRLDDTPHGEPPAGAVGFIEVQGRNLLKHRKHHHKHHRLRKEKAAAAAAASPDEMSTEQLEHKVVSAFTSFTDAIEDVDGKTGEGVANAYQTHVPSLVLKLQEHQKALEHAKEAKANIERANAEADKRLEWLKEAKAAAMKFSENAETKYTEVVAVCKAYQADFKKRADKRNSLLQKAQDYVNLTAQLHKRLLPSVAAP